MDQIATGLVNRDKATLVCGWIEVVRQIGVRPRPCPQTLPMERGLAEFAFINGLWSTFLPGGYVNGGWSVAQLVIPQQAYGVACLCLSGYAFFAYYHGAIHLRRNACLFGLGIMLLVGPLIFAGNPLSPLLPVFIWIGKRRFEILGAFIDHEAEERRKERRRKLLEGDAP